MKIVITYIAVFFFSIFSFAQDPVYELVWSDEFFAAGAVNTNNWHHQTLLPNGDSWYNGEIQHYTNRIDNSFVSNGVLNISAKKESYTDQGVTKQYTSARLNSKFAFTYGKVEVRAKLPAGVGTWPAIWTLGQNIMEPGGYWTDEFGTTSWPACGELDIMEHWGDNQDFVQSAIHSPSSFGNTINKGGQVVQNASNEFHIYTMEWTEDAISFYVDDVLHYTYQPDDQNAATWPFDEKQYILLNVAILPNIDPSITEATMEIDYVRVYQEKILSTHENSLVSFEIYPNPVNTHLNVTVPTNLTGANVTIYSMIGQKIMEKKVDSESIRLHVAGFVRGTYFVQLQKDGIIETAFFVKD